MPWNVIFERFNCSKFHKLKEELANFKQDLVRFGTLLQSGKLFSWSKFTDGIWTGVKSLQLYASSVNFLSSITLRRLTSFEHARTAKVRRKATSTCGRSGMRKGRPAPVHLCNVCDRVDQNARKGTFTPQLCSESDICTLLLFLHKASLEVNSRDHSNVIFHLLIRPLYARMVVRGTIFALPSVWKTAWTVHVWFTHWKWSHHLCSCKEQPRSRSAKSAFTE